MPTPRSIGGEDAWRSGTELALANILSLPRSGKRGRSAAELLFRQEVKTGRWWGLVNDLRDGCACSLPKFSDEVAAGGEGAGPRCDHLAQACGGA